MRTITAGLLALALALPSTATPAEAPADTPDVGGAFELPASTGGRLGSADLAGRPYALFFGFTSCPDVCPMTLSELTLALDALGEAAGDLTVLFVTVDPDRDSVAHLAAYLEAFDPRIVGLSGSPQQTLAVAQAFKATYRKVPLEGGDYTMDHTALVYLMGRDGRFAGSIDFREERSSMVEKLRRLVAGGGA